MHVIPRTLVLLLALGIAAPAAATLDLEQAVSELAQRLVAKNEGHVVSVTAGEAYIDIGAAGGVLPGQEFEIMRRGKAIVSKGKTIGHQESRIGLAEVVRVQAKVSTLRLSEQSEPPRDGDRAIQLRRTIKRVVVAPLSYKDEVTELSREVQDGLINALLLKGIGVVERGQLEQVLREQKMSYSGLVDLGSAKKVGKLLGADSIVLGSLRADSNSVSLTARLVDLETGMALVGSSVKVAKTPDIGSKLRQGADLPVVSEVVEEEKLPVGENKYLKVTALSLVRQGDVLVLKVKYFNKGKEFIRFNVKNQKDDTYLIDDRGNLFTLKEANYKKDNYIGPGASRIYIFKFTSTKHVGNKFEWAAHHGKYAVRVGSEYYDSIFVDIKNIPFQ